MFVYRPSFVSLRSTSAAFYPTMATTLSLRILRRGAPSDLYTLICIRFTWAYTFIFSLPICHLSFLIAHVRVQFYCYKTRCIIRGCGYPNHADVVARGKCCLEISVLTQHTSGMGVTESRPRRRECCIRLTRSRFAVLHTAVPVVQVKDLAEPCSAVGTMSYLPWCEPTETAVRKELKPRRARNGAEQARSESERASATTIQFSTVAHHRLCPSSASTSGTRRLRENTGPFRPHSHWHSSYALLPDLIPPLRPLDKDDQFQQQRRGTQRQRAHPLAPVFVLASAGAQQGRTSF